MDNTQLLTALRSLLLLWSEVTNHVVDRIRPNMFSPSVDGDTSKAVVLNVLDGTQLNTLDRTAAIIDATVEITIRAPLQTEADQIAEAIRTRNTTPSTGLDGYTGSAGAGFLMSAERRSFSSGAEVSDDGDETGNFLSVQVYQIQFKLGG